MSVAVATPTAEQIAQLAQENASLKAALKNMELLVEKLRFQIAQLNRRQFGSSAEGLAQLGLWAPESEPENTPPPIATTLVPAHERAKPVRRPLPDDLPRQ